MTRLHDVTVGKFDQFKRVLAEADLDGELVDAVLKQPQLAGGMVGWLREQLNPPSPDLSELFVPLEVQLSNARRWNAERNWGFTDADFDAIDHTPAIHTGLVVDVIVVYLPDDGKTSGIQRTFEELWDVASSIQPNNWRYESLKSDMKHLRLLDGIEHKPCIRRVTLDLGANWDTTKGILSVDVRGKNSVHAEALAAAAHFPDWVQAMDGERVPYVWMPGYQVTISGDEAWRRLPYLFWSRDDRRVELSASWGGRRLCRLACPVVVRREW
jgi:hypothetical protein